MHRDDVTGGSTRSMFHRLHASSGIAAVLMILSKANSPSCCTLSALQNTL